MFHLLKLTIMAKSVPCTLIGNTAWGYCFTPEKFNSISEARKVAKENVEDGYWFSYRIIREKH